MMSPCLKKMPRQKRGSCSLTTTGFPRVVVGHTEEQEDCGTGRHHLVAQKATAQRQVALGVEHHRVADEINETQGGELSHGSLGEREDEGGTAVA